MITEYFITIAKNGMCFFPHQLTEGIRELKYPELGAKIAFNKDLTKMLIMPSGSIKFKKSHGPVDKFECTLLKILKPKDLIKVETLRYPATLSEKGITLDFTQPTDCYARQTVRFTHEVGK